MLVLVDLTLLSVKSPAMRLRLNKYQKEKVLGIDVG
jgi:hypothetical protein